MIIRHVCREPSHRPSLHAHVILTCTLWGIMIPSFQIKKVSQNCDSSMIMRLIGDTIGIINQVILPSNLLYCPTKLIYKRKSQKHYDIHILLIVRRSATWLIKGRFCCRLIKGSWCSVWLMPLALESGQHRDEPWLHSCGEMSWLWVKLFVFSLLKVSVSSSTKQW